MVAASDLRLARLTAATLRELMRDVPAIDAAIRRAASERLAISYAQHRLEPFRVVGDAEDIR